MKILVVGADQPQGLATLRGLADTTSVLHGAGSAAAPPARWSRSCTNYHRLPSAFTNAETYVTRILDLSREHGYEIIFPVTEAAVIALNAARSRFAGGPRLLMTPAVVLNQSLDKREMYRIAADHGVPIPPSAELVSIDSALAFVRAHGFPVIVKPAAQAGFFGVAKVFPFKVRYAANEIELKMVADSALSCGVPLVIQQFIPGYGVAHGFLRLDGKVAAIYQYRRIREYPLTGGIVTVHESRPLNPELRAMTEAILDAVSYEGIGQMEYRVDERSGAPYLMELNPRLWQPIGAANKIGLHFQRWYLDAYCGRVSSPGTPPPYEIGRKCRYLRYDLAALVHLMTGATRRDLQPLPSVMRAVVDLIRDFSPTVDGLVADLRDPLPGMVEGLQLIREYGGRVSRMPLSAARRRVQGGPTPSTPPSA